ncbi:adenylate kinase family protein [Rugosimonospora africana]|nr:AAA family ATPase [Rugosimonospora africana]
MTYRSHAGTAPVTGAVLVAVVGPPGAGKSTVVRCLAAEFGLPVFRLREAVRARPELLGGLAPSGDPLGWVGLEAVRRVLRATFLDRGFGVGYSAVLLDNFPGTAEQLALLAEIGEATCARVTLLELDADAPTVMNRIVQRRVCLVCGPDPHTPAVPAADDPLRCRSCQTVLARRDTDRPRLHAGRLARYTANRPEIANCAAERGIPHVVVNADTTMSEVCRAAQRAVSRLIESAESPGSRP